MRNLTHDVPVSFRTNSRLLAAAQAKANRQGMSLAEFLRATLRKEIGSC